MNVLAMRRSILPVLLAVWAGGCAAAQLERPEVAGPGAATVPAWVKDTLAAIRQDWAPDRRVARFDVEVEAAAGGVVLKGETDQPWAADRLRRALEALDVAYVDSIRLLPDAAVRGERWALVNLSAANLRVTRGHGAELATQALLGTPVRVVDHQGGWTLVQVPDGYLAWVDGGGIHPVSEAELEAHRAAEKVIYLKLEGVALSEPRAGSAPVSDLVAGDILVLESEADGWYRVRYPDGRTAYVPVAEAARYDDWLAGLRATESSLVETALSMLGRPYLWGGTSPKGMDCSGFTKTVYLLNGLILPRDASQQAQAGERVDSTGDFARLRPGDLLFFGRAATDSTPERVVHVAMWIGGGRFIHSSGRVQINSMDPADPLYDEYERGRYLRASRILGSQVGVQSLAAGALYPVDGRFAPAATAGPAARARWIHDRTLTLDSHVDVVGGFGTRDDPCGPTRRQVDVPKMEAGGLDAVFYAVYVGQGERTPEAYEQAKSVALERFAAIHRVAEEGCPALFEIAYTADDVERIVRSGKRAIAIGIENGYVIGRDLAMLRRYYDLGARYITLSHVGHNDISDSANPRAQRGEPLAEHGGLSAFGEQVVREMNRLGMMVDVSHISGEAVLDVVRVSRAPVIASHSAARGLVPIPRNLGDEQLRAIRDNGGVVQVAGFADYVKIPDPAKTAALEALEEELGLTTPEQWRAATAEQRAEYERRVAEIEKRWPGGSLVDLVDHIDYVVQRIGIDHVGLGSDFDGGGGVRGWASAAESANITAELLRRGYSPEAIAKIWGGNLLRVWRENERIARELQVAEQDG